MTDPTTRPYGLPQTPPARFVARLERLRPVAEELAALLYTYSEEESPEVIWLRDIQSRYPLTELGNPARQALAQAQRINRSQRRHLQLGLCEFQIGLIFLYYRADCQFATAQFEKARRQWQFVSETAAVCLTHYAQGVVYYHDQEYEAALHQFSLIEPLMRRLTFSSNQNVQVFMNRLQEDLVVNKKILLAEMWPPDAEPPQIIAPPSSGTVRQPVDNSSGAARSGAENGRSQPPQEPIEEGKTAAEGHTPGRTPRPIDRMNSPTPVPSHLMRGEQFVWYEVVAPAGQLSAERFPTGACLLVEREGAVEFGSAIVIKEAQNNVRGGVIVKPLDTKAELGYRFRIYYAGEPEGVRPIEWATFGDPRADDFELNVESQRRIAIDKHMVVGTVVGVWSPISLV